MSYQDTLLSQTGTQIYLSCSISGAVHFIFGQEAQTWISNSTITVTAGGGAITASGRASPSSSSIYVINNSTINGSASVKPASVFLGRPWREYARVVVQNSFLGDVVNAAGWEVWQRADARTTGVVFEEFGNKGPGASGARVSFASILNAPVGIESVLGSAYVSWVDASYL